MTRQEAIRYRGIIEQAVQSLDEGTALTAVTLYPRWAEAADYAEGILVQHGDGLFRCLQAHTALAGWEPEIAASLWERIQLTHAGTREDPIPYEGNMVLHSGKYYSQKGAVYLCFRDTVNPVVQDLQALVGLYVEVV